MEQEYQVISSGNEKIYDAIKRYLEKSKLITGRFKGKIGEVDFLGEGKMFFNPKKLIIGKNDISPEISKKLEKIIKKNKEK